jgi:hypothetical protein
MLTTKEAMEALERFDADAAIDPRDAGAVSTLRQFIEEAGRDAERWRHARGCIRMDNFGGYVVHPDDPAEFNGIVAQRFEREIDAARASQPGQEG